jgi:hypothetical protein
MLKDLIGKNLELPSQNHDGELVDLTSGKPCNKELGNKEQPTRSRGLLFVVRACGHIDRWAPIYKYVYLRLFFVHIFTAM